MKNLREPLSLLEIENLLAKELKDPKKTMRVLGDMDINYEDYLYLILKLKGLDLYKGNLKVLEKYKLSLIISWSFALRMEKAENIGYERLKKIIVNLLQHQFRFCINLFANVFDEYGIETFALDINSLESLLSVIALHAGIPKEAHNDFFHLLDDSLCYMDIGNLQDGFLWGLSPRMEQLYPRMQQLYRYIDEETRVKTFKQFRDMFINVKIKKMSEKEVLENYPLISYDLIQGCFQWNREYEEKSRQLRVIYN